LNVLQVVSEAVPDLDLDIKSHLFGGAAIDATGQPLPKETLEACKAADAVLMGMLLVLSLMRPMIAAIPVSDRLPSHCVLQPKFKVFRFINSHINIGSVGGPKWGVGPVRPEQGLLALRKELGLYANIRPASFASDSLLAYSPLKESVAKGVDFIVIRELIGGLYFGERKELTSSLADQSQGQSYAPTDGAYDTMIYTVAEVERITRVAAQIALTTNPPLAIHSIDKANVLASSRLWRKIVTDTIKRE
jgi:3-isopropylmalate dehydrogenase